MKTPHAILIGLALIAAALLFREPSIDPAHAALGLGGDGINCVPLKKTHVMCAIYEDNTITFVWPELTYAERQDMIQGRGDDKKPVAYVRSSLPD